jgi:hypothetical protein
MRRRKARRAVAPIPRGIQGFLIQYLTDHPNSAFGQAVAIARSEFGVSRTTVARHLATLVRLGELRVERGVYSIPEPTGAGTNFERDCEFRHLDSVEVVQPDGSVWAHQGVEFRVKYGQLRRLCLLGDTPFENLRPWCSTPIRLRWVPGELPRRPQRACIEFTPPLRALDARWVRLVHSHEFPHRFRMYREADLVPGAARHPADLSEEFEDTGVPQSFSRGDESEGLGSLFALRIILPKGYPFRAPAYHIFAPGPEVRSDPVERKRVQRLTEQKGGYLGFRVDGSALSLVVPDPVPGDRYLIRWSLPTHQIYRQWLALRTPPS